MAEVLISEIGNTVTTPVATAEMEIEVAESNTSSNITLENLGKFYLRNRSHIRLAGAGSRNKVYADRVCDGTADQTDVMNAIGDLPVGGGVVELLDGEFLVNAPITWEKDSVTLMGQGRGDRVASSLADTIAVGTRIRAVTGFTGSDIIKVYREDLARPVAQTRLCDFTVDGNNIGTAVTGINILSFRNVVERVAVFECTGYGIYVDGLAAWNPYDCFYDKLLLGFNDLDGLYFAANSPDAHVAKVIAYSNGRDGIAMEGASHQLVSIHTYNNTRYGIMASSARNKIINWKCEQNGEHGLFVDSGTIDLQVTGANFKNAGQTTHNTYDHIYLQAGGAAVLRTSLTNINISSTSPANEARYGINVAGAAVEDTIVTGLRINTTNGTFATAAINDAGKRTMIEGVSVNAGNPASAGNWNGVTREGVIVRDTTPGSVYVCIRDTWVALT